MKPLASGRIPKRFGRIRQSDNSLVKAGIKAGDLVIINLTKKPEQDELCAAFTAKGDLVVRYFHRERGGHIRLSTKLGAKVFQLFSPSAVIIFGCVREIVKAAT